MTEEDLKPLSKEQIAEDLQELIKEAKSKIRPVFMSQEDRQKYIQPYENFLKTYDNWHLIDIERLGTEILDYQKINLEILRKIQDKKYEIDLDYERTRDLYEKQRVIDKFLEEHQEDNRVLNQYYQNNYQTGK